MVLIIQGASTGAQLHCSGDWQLNASHENVFGGTHQWLDKNQLREWVVNIAQNWEHPVGNEATIVPSLATLKERLFSSK